MSQFMSSRLTRLAGVSLVAALALTGCSAQSEEAPNSTGEVTGELSIATTSDVGIGALIESFEKETGVGFETTFAEAGALNEQLSLQINGGTAPDIFRSAPGWAAPSSVLNLAAIGAVRDLSGEDWTANVPKAFDSLQVYEGGTYAYPTFGQAILAFYNISVFEEVGVTPPTTWDELIEVSDKLKAAGKVPISLGFADNYVTQFITYALSATLVNGAEPDFYEELDAGKTTFAESDGWRETFEKIVSLIDDGYTTADPLGTPGDPAMQAVGNGDAAIVIMPSGASPNLAKMTEGGWDNLGIFAFPATNSADDTFIPFSPDFLVVSSKTENPDAALAFLDHISQPDNAAAFAEAQGAIPALTNATPVDNQLNTAIQVYLDEERTTPFANHIWPGGEVAAALMAGLQQVVQGDKDIDGLLADLDTAYAGVKR
ncbi:ABC transporter substrate-binding protein [Microbacterium sp. MC2]